ncbi:MAG: hypothetical protein NUW37_16055 [Planctomycetes bacterium]|nr:hypothetical protein [Planctomycetota bacterium]
MVSPIAGATSAQSLMTSIDPGSNATELVARNADVAQNRNIGAVVNTPVIVDRVGGERGNLISMLS